MDFSGMGQMMGAVPGGFQQGQIANNQIDQSQLAIIDARAKQAGAQAYFRALQGMFAPPGQTPPGTPAPGQPSQPMAQGGPMPGPQIMGPRGPAQADAQGVYPSNAVMMPQMQTAQASGVPSSPAGPPGSPQQSVPPVGQPGGQNLSWQQIVQALKQQNPGASDLELAHAVDHFMPMMNQQMQLDWRNARNQLMMELGILRSNTSIQNTDTRAAATTDAAGTRAAATTDAASIRAAETAANRDQRGAQFQQREDRLERALQLRGDQGWQRLQQQKDQAQQRIAAGDRRQAVVEWRAALDAQHKMALEKINATNINNAMKPEERKKLLADQEAWYRDQIGKLNNLTTQRGNVSDQPQAGPAQVEDVPPGQPLPGAKSAAPAAAAPQASAAPAGGVPVPQAFAGDPDGTTYQKDGKTWTKRGNQLVIENGG